MRRRPLLQAAACALGAGLARAQSALPDERALTVACGTDRWSTDPQRFTFTLRTPHAQIAETAVRPDERFEPAPLLFQRWQVREGRYRVALRPGVRGHDGSVFDSDAAIAALRLVGDSRSDFLRIAPASFRRVDALNFEFTSADGSNLVIQNMSHRASSLFVAGSARATKPQGTGPYRFVRYEPRRLLEVQRHAGYWGAAPKQPRVLFRFVPDGQARMLALAKGEVDVVADVTPQMLLALPPGGAGPARLHVSRPTSYVALLANIRGEPPYTTLADARVRRALAHGVDREALARVLFAGRGVPARGLLPDWMFGLGEHTRGHAFDPAAAARLLDEAGWRRGDSPSGLRSRDGQPLRLKVVSAYPSASTVAPLPEMLEQMWRKLGIATEIVAVEDDQLYNERQLGAGAADLFIEHAGNPSLDPTFLLYNLFHGRSSWQPYRWIRPAAPQGAAFDAALDAARADDDPARRIDAVRRAHRIVVDEAVVAIPLLLVPQFVLARPGVAVPMFEHRDWIDYGAVTLPG
jgi:peptide/nickel transport system substrate-binding protein